MQVDDHAVLADVSCGVHRQHDIASSQAQHWHCSHRAVCSDLPCGRVGRKADAAPKQKVEGLSGSVARVRVSVALAAEPRRAVQRTPPLTAATGRRPRAGSRCPSPRRIQGRTPQRPHGNLETRSGHCFPPTCSSQRQTGGRRRRCLAQSPRGRTSRAPRRRLGERQGRRGGHRPPGLAGQAGFLGLHEKRCAGSREVWMSGLACAPCTEIGVPAAEGVDERFEQMRERGRIGVAT
eukprot:364943-Chlamydomonas_euryale.AAC.31